MDLNGMAEILEGMELVKVADLVQGTQGIRYIIAVGAAPENEKHWQNVRFSLGVSSR